MIKRVTIRDVRITLTIARIVKVGGFNSLLTDGNHILMWDFDDTTLKKVKHSLEDVQVRFMLPKIYILESSKGINFMAYCFQRTSWREVVEAVASTEGVDQTFFGYGVLRGKLTLRVTDKGRGKPHLVAALDSDVPEDVSIWELGTWVNYETLKPK